MASINATTYIISSGLCCYYLTTDSIFSVMRLIRLSDTSKPHISPMCADMAFDVIPFSCIDNIFFDIFCKRGFVLFNNLWIKLAVSVARTCSLRFFTVSSVFYGYKIIISCYLVNIFKRIIILAKYPHRQQVLQMVGYEYFIISYILIIGLKSINNNVYKT